MSTSNCGFLTCIQISQEAGQVVWYSHLFHNFTQFIVIHTVKGFGIVNKAEIDVFFGTLLLFWWSLTLQNYNWHFDIFQNNKAVLEPFNSIYPHQDFYAIYYFYSIFNLNPIRHYTLSIYLDSFPYLPFLWCLIFFFFSCLFDHPPRVKILLPEENPFIFPFVWVH